MEICSAPSYGVALLLPMVSHWEDPASVVRSFSNIPRKIIILRTNRYFMKIPHLLCGPFQIFNKQNTDFMKQLQFFNRF